MKLSETYAAGRFGLSFELFPPKTSAGEASLFRHVARLAEFKPQMITCTYGAGGSTRNKTLDVVTRVRQDFNCPVAAHLTCVGSTTDELRAYLADASQRKIENLVALRGDPPRGETRFEPVEGGLTYASELVTLVREEFPNFGIAVAGYPETHRDAPSAEDDLKYLKQKVDCGADIVITQLFYVNDDFYRFRDRCGAAGINVPIVPGILPVTSLAQIQRITSLCGAHLPSELLNALEGQGESAEGQFEQGVAFAVRQTQDLIDQGVPGVHFYVLNKSEATAQVLNAVTPQR